MFLTVVLYYCDILFGLYPQRYHNVLKEEPSLKTLWLQNIETMDKVQRIDRRK
jgi:hypothetical protein